MIFDALAHFSADVSEAISFVVRAIAGLVAAAFFAGVVLVAWLRGTLDG